MSNNRVALNYWVDAKYLEPYFEIWIGGKKLDYEIMRLVEEVVYEDHAHGSDICTIVINDPLQKLVEDKQFAQEAPFKLIGGFRFKRREMMKGYIALVDYQYPDDGCPQLVIHAMDETYKADKKFVKKTFKNTTRWAVIQQIVAKYGWKVRGKPNKWLSKKEDTISQSDQTDIQFILSLADECNCIAFYRSGYIYVYERDYKAKPVKTYRYKQPPFDIISFDSRVVVKDLEQEFENDNLDNNGNSTKKTTKK